MMKLKFRMTKRRSLEGCAHTRTKHNIPGKNLKAALDEFDLIPYHSIDGGWRVVVGILLMTLKVVGGGGFIIAVAFPLARCDELIEVGGRVWRRGSAVNVHGGWQRHDCSHSLKLRITREPPW